MIQCLHSDPFPKRINGRFNIRYGRGTVAKALARMLRLPAEAQFAQLRLTIEAGSRNEIWNRQFNGNRTIVTTQFKAPDGYLGESFGLVEFRFELAVKSGRLLYIQRRVGLRIGCFAIRLPAWLAPQVQAAEELSAVADCIETSVEVILPLTGRLFAYGGMLDKIG